MNVENLFTTAPLYYLREHVRRKEMPIDVRLLYRAALAWRLWCARK